MIELKGMRNLLLFLREGGGDGKHYLFKNSLNQRQTSVSLLFRFKGSNINEISQFQCLKSSQTDSPEAISKVISANRQALLVQIDSLLIKQGQRRESNQEIIDDNDKKSFQLLKNQFSTIEQSFPLPPSIEMLLIKRSTRKNDLHSGQIAFPGGNLDGFSENDLQAAARETKEEIGISLEENKNYAYLGRLPLNIFAYYRQQKKVMISVNLFIQLNSEQDEFAINEDEVEKAFWTPLSSFIFPDEKTFYLKDLHKRPSNVFAKNQSVLRILDYLLFKNYSHTKACHMIVQGEELFGLTFYMIIYILRAMYQRKSVNLVDSSKLCYLSTLLKQSQFYTFHYSPSNMFRSQFANKLYYLLRMKQFEELL